MKCLEFRGCFTGFSWSCFAAPRFNCNCNVLQMLWYCTKQHEEKLFRTWFYMKVTDGSLCCLIDDCWPWCYLTLMVITVEDTGWMYSAHLTRYWQRAILCKPHCVVLPVNLRLQSCCVWFISLLVTTRSKRLLSQTLHLKVSKRHEK